MSLLRAFVAAMLTYGAIAAADSPMQPSVEPMLRGSAHVVSVAYDGCELRPRAIDSINAPLAVRVIGRSAPGIWSLEIIGNKVGQFDASEYLQCADGSSPTGLPSIPVRFISVIPAGVPLDIERSVLPVVRVSRSLRWLWPALGAVWILAPVLWFLWRAAERRKSIPDTALVQESIAQQPTGLRDLIDALGSRPLSTEERARLELLTLRELVPADRSTSGDSHAENLYTRLSTIPEAAPVLLALENFLHRPEPLPEAEYELRDRLLAITVRATPQPEEMP